MTVGAVGLITNVLREHTACIGMSGPDTWFYPSCEGCQWTESKVRTGDEAVTLHAEHVAREVDAALGGLAGEWAVALNGVIGFATSDRDRAERELTTAQRNNTYWAKHHGSAPDWASDPSLSRRWVSGWTPEEAEK